MRVLVTGASGFLGLNLVARLLATDHEPVAFVRDSEQLRGMPVRELRVAEGDVTERDDIAEAVHEHDCDSSVHLAAMHGRYGDGQTQGGPDRDLMMSVNVGGTENLLEVAAEADLETVVMAGTLKSHPTFDEEAGTDYVESKRRAQRRFGKYDVAYSVVNPSTVIGPLDYRLIHYNMYNIVCSNRMLMPPMYIPKKINFVHVEDVVESILYYLSEPSGTCKLVTGPNTSMASYCRTIADIAETSSTVLPAPLARRYLPKVLDFMHGIGLLPVDSSQFNWSDRSIPSQVAMRGPVDHHGIRTIVEDTYGWYSDIGLL